MSSMNVPIGFTMIWRVVFSVSSYIFYTLRLKSLILRVILETLGVDFDTKLKDDILLLYVFCSYTHEAYDNILDDVPTLF